MTFTNNHIGNPRVIVSFDCLRSAKTATSQGALRVVHFGAIPMEVEINIKNTDYVMLAPWIAVLLFSLTWDNVLHSPQLVCGWLVSVRTRRLHSCGIHIRVTPLQSATLIGTTARRHPLKAQTVWRWIQSLATGQILCAIQLKFTSYAKLITETGLHVTIRSLWLLVVSVCVSICCVRGVCTI